MAGLGIHAEGFLGIAFEATYGTYTAPTRFFPIKSESLTEPFEHQKRQLIRGIADTLGHVRGFSRVEGDITMELIPDLLPYFLYVSRNTVAKTGSTPNFIYTTTPGHYGASAALPAGKKGLSITVVRNGDAYGYVGCIVTGMEFSVDNGIPTFKATIIGRAEASQSVPTPTYLTTDLPFGAGLFDIQVPTAVTVFDLASFTFTTNDNGEAQNRLLNSTYAQWVKFGAREATCQTERDYTSRAELDAYKALTFKSVTINMVKDANTQINLTLPNCTPDSYDGDGLSDQGSATMVRVTYTADYDIGTGKSYQIVCKCQENIA